MAILARAQKVGRKFQNPVETTVGGPGMILKVLKQYRTNKEERVPRQKLGPFHTDSTLFSQQSPGGLRVTWMGHSCMLIEMDGVRILVDPMWDQRASPVRWAGPKRFFEAPLELEDLPPLDAVLVSHDHYDHLGKQTIRRLAHLDATWVTSLGVGNALRKFGVKKQSTTELDWTESVKIGAEMTITALPARHFSGRMPWGRFQTLWSSFVLKTSRHNVYYGADSGMWDGFPAIGQQYGPFDLTMLEIGAYNELWKSIHMGPDGAAKAFRDMAGSSLDGSGLLMPIHWGLFDLALHAWRQPIQRMTELADQLGIKLWSPAPGVPTEVVTGQELRSDWWKLDSMALPIK